MKLRQIFSVLALLLSAGTATLATAHENLPASLILQQQSSEVFDVRWRIPQTQGAAPEVMPVFPADCSALAQPVEISSPGARLRQWHIRCKQGLRNDARIYFDGLAFTMIDVLVRASYLDGGSEARIARPREPEVVLRPEAAKGLAVSSYFGLGVQHILAGADHLLFVLCLVMLVPNLLALLKTVTAFTIAHSLTLALSALGMVHLPQPPVEATIALSIVFLARELARPGGATGVAMRWPWAVALAFGLLHGFGFAGALAEIGLPEGDIPLALLLFNLGVEAGQIAFVACVYPMLLLVRRFQAWPRWAGVLPIYTLGAVAGFWWLQRMVPILGVQAFLA